VRCYYPPAPKHSEAAAAARPIGAAGSMQTLGILYRFAALRRRLHVGQVGGFASLPQVFSPTGYCVRTCISLCFSQLLTNLRGPRERCRSRRCWVDACPLSGRPKAANDSPDSREIFRQRAQVRRDLHESALPVK
jgi:hypothetical protein